MMMRVLVACEFSGVVRDAFAAHGHDAWSCDLLPTERHGSHLQCDVLTVLNQGWDLMIAHPPCTYLCRSGERWIKGNPERQREREKAIRFVKLLWEAPIRAIAIENPVGCLSSRFRKPSQIIQPYDFGHGETKATCLWLKNLPLLQPTQISFGREHRIHEMAPGKRRGLERSRTLTGIAEAMAEQWGHHFMRARSVTSPKASSAEAVQYSYADCCETCVCGLALTLWTQSSPPLAKPLWRSGFWKKERVV